MNWISVEDELPKEDCRVDVWIPEYDDEYKRYPDANFSFENKEFFTDYDLLDITEDVTHWMPLPKPPE